MEYGSQAVADRLEHVFGSPLHSEKCDVQFGQEHGSLACFRGNVGGRPRHLVVDVRNGPLKEIAEIENRARRVSEELPGHTFLVATYYLTDRARNRLEAAGVNYLDFSGHVFIRTDDLFVRIEEPADTPAPRPRASKGPSPFAKKASFVPRLMLEHPQRRWGVREMTGLIPLSVGHVSNVLREMVRRGYAAEDEGGSRLASPERLLAGWSAEYSWEDNDIYSLLVPYEQDSVERALGRFLEDEGLRYALTLLGGSDRLAPRVVHDQVHLYVEEQGVELLLEFLRSSLHAEPVSQGGNVHILQPYYREAAFFGAERDHGMPVVSAVQLFLDLVGYPLRGQEAARELLRTRLRPKLDLSKEAVHWLTEFSEI